MENANHRETTAAMIPRIKSIQTLPDFILKVQFEDGKTVQYDVKDDIAHIPAFRNLLTETSLFPNFQLDKSRTCITWNEVIDLPSDSIYEFGVSC